MVQVEGEAVGHAPDEVGRVAGEYGDVVAGAVGDALGQPQLEEALGAAQPVVHVDQFVRVEHLHRLYAVPCREPADDRVGRVLKLVQSRFLVILRLGAGRFPGGPVPLQQGGPQVAGPPVHRAGEVTGGVRGTALQH